MSEFISKHWVYLIGAVLLHVVFAAVFGLTMVNIWSKPLKPTLAIQAVVVDRSVIDRAAQLRGRSRTEFMRDAAVRAAEDAIMENTLIRVSPDGFQAFVAALDAPGKPVRAMVDVLKRPAPWETSAKK